MKPQEWLELTKKHVETPEEITEEELAALRSNYIVWGAGLEMLKFEAKGPWGKALRQVTKGDVIDDDKFKTLLSGNYVEVEGASQEEIEAFQKENEIHRRVMTNIMAAISHRKFLKVFDEQFVVENGDESPEIQEILWKKKAENLAKAIDTHRRSHVLANKEANGLDFALWAEIDKDEFHASRHLGMTLNGTVGGFKD